MDFGDMLDVYKFYDGVNENIRRTEEAINTGINPETGEPFQSPEQMQRYENLLVQQYALKDSVGRRFGLTEMDVSDQATPLPGG